MGSACRKAGSVELGKGMSSPSQEPVIMALLVASKRSTQIGQGLFFCQQVVFQNQSTSEAAVEMPRINEHPLTLCPLDVEKEVR